MSILEEFISIEPALHRNVVWRGKTFFAFDGWLFSLECMIEERKRKVRNFHA